MDNITSAVNWLKENHEWVFSGAGVAVISTVFTGTIALLVLFFKRKKKPETPSPPIEKEDNSQTTSQSAVITGDNNTSTQISNSPGAKVINNDKVR